ncbi:hypothetical protein LZQ00_04330 [Sphingobacterium sp. SRCM116780]|uniref:hypothetical protein n=1 Tax=Sphingobacterium sp. SRCM116780 TaxID=2907623 RepID=UPI001F441A19|nr:hypothetical protein [Sphingobacterium sp. SRCM116780]UIR57043.1 hypothetical protein LZQ00_04330 [Sphingobacterium sp. SRCM116780]
MKKLIHIVFLTLVLSQSVVAQDKIWQIKLNFKGEVSQAELEKSVPAFAVDFYEPYVKGVASFKEVTVFISPSNIKSIYPQGHILITDRIKKQEFSYTNGDDMLSQETLSADLPLLTAQEQNDNGYLVLENATEKEKIGNVDCIKAILKVVDPSAGEIAMTVWYAPDIPSYYLSNFPFLINLPGAVLKLDDQINPALGFEVAEVKEITDSKTFDLPPHVQIVNLSKSADSTHSEDISLFQDAFKLKAPLEWFSQKNETYGDEYLYGVKKADGSIVQPAIFYSIDVLNDERAIVSDSDNLFWIIDDEAKKINHVGFEILYGINDENMVYAIDDQYGIINASGVSIIGGLSNISNFVGEYLLFTQRGKQGLLDFNGKIVLQPTLESIDTDDQGNILVKDLEVSQETQQYSLEDFQVKYLK